MAKQPTQAQQDALCGYAAGYLTGVMSKDSSISKITAVTDDAGVITGELFFYLSGWQFSIIIEARGQVS